MAEISKPVRTRFAPSPTGYVHVGSLRTALFAFLFARHHGGVNVLRVEDTDQNRLVEGAVENLVAVMSQLGVTFDEGYVLDDSGTLVQRGEFGPYLQSERLSLYQQHVQELLDQKKAYYCFCSEQRLEELRTEQMALKKPPMYDRHCRTLSAEDVKKQLAEFAAAGKNPVVRFAIPEGQTVVHDEIYGDISYDNKVLDDQVILKSDKFPTYHLAVVVDDHHMQITHVIRGEEWIPSTPKHILLYQAFGWEPTVFAHLPLIFNPDKSKLSKRQGDVAVEDFLKKGYLPEALLNFVAFLGWNPKTEQEIFSLQELIDQFELPKVNKSGAVFDTNKLDWINAHYLRAKEVGELAELLTPYWHRDGYAVFEGESVVLTHLDKTVSKEYLSDIVQLERERLKKLSEIGERTPYFFKLPDAASVAELLVAKKSSPEATKRGLEVLVAEFASYTLVDFELATLEEKVKAMMTDKGLQNFDVLWPMRVALTGLSASPSPFEVASVLAKHLGPEAVLERLKTAASSLS